MDQVVAQIRENLEDIQDRMDQAAVKCGRKPSEVQLVVVTKTRPVEVIRAAILAGAKLLGENYPDEAQLKIQELQRENMGGVSWHMIGHVQSRKARIVADHFDFLHSLDSVKLANKLEGILSETGKVLPVLLEFNVGGEESKSGWDANDEGRWSELLPAVEQILKLKHLAPCGLMTMPPLFGNPEEARPFFRKLRKLREFLESQFEGVNLQNLSMGTSVDFEVAIEEGATFVRIGQAILGARAPKT